MKSKPIKNNDGNLKHAETLGGEYIFQATSAFGEYVRGLLRQFTAVLEKLQTGLVPSATFCRRALDPLSNRTAV
jgi:hypothetical protein